MCAVWPKSTQQPLRLRLVSKGTWKVRFSLGVRALLVLETEACATAAGFKRRLGGSVIRRTRSHGDPPPPATIAADLVVVDPNAVYRVAPIPDGHRRLADDGATPQHHHHNGSGSTRGAPRGGAKRRTTGVAR